MPVFQSNPPLDKRWLGKVCTILTLCATVGLSLNMLAAHIFATWPSEQITREQALWTLVRDWWHNKPMVATYEAELSSEADFYKTFLWIALILSVSLLLTAVAGILAGRQWWLLGVLPLVVFLIVFFVGGTNQPIPDNPYFDKENGIPQPYLAFCWLIGSIRWQTFWIFAFFWLASAVATACCILQLWFDRKQKQPARG